MASAKSRWGPSWAALRRGGPPDDERRLAGPRRGRGGGGAVPPLVLTTAGSRLIIRAASSSSCASALSRLVQEHEHVQQRLPTAVHHQKAQHHATNRGIDCKQRHRQALGHVAFAAARARRPALGVVAQIANHDGQQVGVPSRLQHLLHQLLQRFQGRVARQRQHLQERRLGLFVPAVRFFHGIIVPCWHGRIAAAFVAVTAFLLVAGHDFLWIERSEGTFVCVPC